jgi:transcriptional regulator with XRE-family HTH domain
MPAPSFATLWTDDAVLRELGVRLGQHRLQQGLSQAKLAHEAGISLRTITRLEAGESIQLENLISVLRVLGLVSGLDALVPAPEPSPLALVKAMQAAPKRAPRRTAAPSAAAPRKPWTWGDEP